MKIRVLGSYGARIPGCRASSLLVNEQLLLDAGTIATALSLDEQVAVSDVLLTHAHLDHMVDLAFLVDNTLVQRSEPLRVWAPQPVLEAVHRHLFNDEIWPDFTRLPTADNPALQLIRLDEETEQTVAGITVRWVPVNHTVFTAGYCLIEGDAAVLYSGDTGTTEALWRMARRCTGLKAAFIETSFPDRLADLARASGHLTPAGLAGELKKLDRNEVPVKIFHMKPQFLQEILAELNALEGPSLQVLEGGEEFHF